MKNLNSKKWINDNLKIKSTLYSRKTVADYDGSATDETEYISDNRMHVLQSSLEHKTKNSYNCICRINLLISQSLSPLLFNISIFHIYCIFWMFLLIPIWSL